VLQSCLTRQHAPNLHVFVWPLREHSVDEVSQFLQQVLA
jgi:hypothetical protein